MDWGVTDKGFRRKAYADIIASMEAKARDLFGADIDLSSASPLALFLRVVSFALSLLWSVAERVYYSAYISTARGQSLDYAVKFAGLVRRPATPARRMLRFTGDPGRSIPRGFLVETAEGPPRYATLAPATIGPDGTVDVLAEAVEPGTASNVVDGTLTVIVNPLPGVMAVTNIDHPDNIDGLDRETDRELRERYFRSLARGGTSTLDAILAAVLAVPTVRTARVFHNTSMEVDEAGRPPKSVEVVVLGGVSEDVAKAIHQTIAAGIQPHGNIEVPVVDLGGQTRLIRFSRAEVVDVWVTVEVAAGAAYPEDGDDQVRNAIIRYIGGTDTFGELHPGLGLGEHVIWTALVAAARQVPGVIDVDITVGTKPDPDTRQNLVILGHQVAEAAPERVVVTRG